MRCDGAQLAYLVVSEGGVGGVGERLHALDPRQLRFGTDGVASDLTGDALRTIRNELGQLSELLTADSLLGLPLAEAERRLIEATLLLHGGSIPKAARVLDVSPSTLYRKIEAWAAKAS